jgi:cell wall-associated NlpC family hydrolase
MTTIRRFPLALLFALAALPALARETPPARDSLGVLDVTEAQLSAAYWIARQEQADALLLDAGEIRALNARLLREDDSMHDLRALPSSLDRQQVARWVEGLADAPQSTLYDVAGKAVATEVLQAILANRQLDAIPASQATRYGMVVARADLRTFPSTLRVFRSDDDTDIDRFQESAEFPGTPLVIAHESADGQWWFVVSPRYAAWIEKRHVALGGAEQVFAHVDRTPYRIVTGANVRTVHTREAPALSQLQLDMGLRLPLHTNWPVDQVVNGQHPYTAHVIDLPIRAEDGTLGFAAALLQKNADSSADYLPLTRANIIRQSFKFLGERYGWGHAYDGRDCSGFVAEVYRSMGVVMPRNTSDQGVSPAFAHRLFTGDDTSAQRHAAARATEVGDLVYIPGHVMLVIGHIDGEPWVIHDTTGISWRTPQGGLARTRLNGVAVTPLVPLQFDDQDSYIQRMRSIVSIRPPTATEAPTRP